MEGGQADGEESGVEHRCLYLQEGFRGRWVELEGGGGMIESVEEQSVRAMKALEMEECCWTFALM